MLAFYPALPYVLLMEFIETSLFTKLLYGYLTESEYAALQQFLLESPEAGNVVPGSGGVRKLRWGLKDRGKRGGVRVLYYFKRNDGEIWFLTMYAKNEAENIPASTLRQIAEEIHNA